MSETSQSIFSYDDYKDFIRDRVKHVNKWGSLTSFANRVGIQRSYLSRVIHSGVQITPDQAYEISRHWDLSDREREYFMTLVDLARAGTKSYKDHLVDKLQALRKKHEDLSRIVPRRPPDMSSYGNLYYSQWFWSAVHIIVSIQKYQTPSAIASRLGLPESLVEATLNQLADFGLISCKSKKWHYSSGEIHVPRQSPFVSLHHHHWRSRAVLDSYDSENDSLHYTSVQAISREAFVKIKDLLVSTIEKEEALAGPSRSEELTCFAVDFFRV